jgi:hypothetical protein
LKPTVASSIELTPSIKDALQDCIISACFRSTPTRFRFACSTPIDSQSDFDNEADRLEWRVMPPTDPRPCQQFPPWLLLGDTKRHPFEVDGGTPVSRPLPPAQTPFALAAQRLPLSWINTSLDPPVSLCGSERINLAVRCSDGATRDDRQRLQSRTKVCVIARLRALSSARLRPSGSAQARLEAILDTSYERRRPARPWQGPP